MLDVWPDGVSQEAFLAGVDIKNTPGWRVEVKATRDGTTTGAMTQCEKHPGIGTPVVIWRPDGYGENKIGDWLVVMRLHDFKDLVRNDRGDDSSLGRDARRGSVATAGFRGAPTLGDRSPGAPELGRSVDAG